MRALRTTTFTLGVLLLAFVPRPLFAAPAAPAAPSKKSATPKIVPLAEALTGDAKNDYEAGKVYFNDNDFAHAFLKFQSAYEKSKDARLLWNMAACQKELRKYAKVIPLVERYLKEADALLTPDDKARADALLAAIRPGTTLLRVEVTEPDAEIFLDDELLGKSPLADAILIDQGPRKLIVKKQGFDVFEQSLNVESPELVRRVQLVKTVHMGTLFVHAGVNDSISLDGKIVGQGIYNAKVESGAHVLAVTAPGMRPFQGDVLVEDNVTRDVPIALDRAETKVVVPTWLWYTIAGAVVVAGTVITIVVIANQNPTPEYKGQNGTLNPGLVQLQKFSAFRF